MRPVKFAHKKKRYMSPRWDDDQRRLLVKLWEAEESFEDIACEVNKLIHIRAQAGGSDITPRRTAKAVAMQCVKLGFITQNELQRWEKDYRKALRRDRYAGLRQARAEILQRDGSACAICESCMELEFAHVVPFSLTRKNRSRESITLCRHHHREFDDGKPWCVKAVYRKMCEYYPDYENSYEYSNCKCGKSHITLKATSAD